MLGRISSYSYERCYPSRLKKFFRSGIGYNNYVDIIPNVKNSIVGDLPPEIISLADGNKAYKLKCFQDLLGNISGYLRAFNQDWQEQSSPVEISFKKAVNDVLNKLEYMNKKILSEIFPDKNLNIELDYAGRGEFANVYRMSIKDLNSGEKIMHDKALKVYHSVIDWDKRWHYTNGNYAEANLWTYLKYAAGHSLAKTQFTRHYISDMKNAYALTEFIDKDISKTTSILDYYEMLGIRDFDYLDNKPILGKLYDVGLFCAQNNFIADKVVLRYFKKLYNRNPKKDLKPVLAALELKAKDVKEQHRTKIQKAIDLFKLKFSDRLKD